MVQVGVWLQGIRRHAYTGGNSRTAEHFLSLGTDICIRYVSPYGRCGALTSLMRKVLKLSAMAPRRQRVKMAVILLVPCRDEKVVVNDGIEMFFDGFAAIFSGLALKSINDAQVGSDRELVPRCVA